MTLTLDRILEDALGNPEIAQNTTVLNTEHYHTIRAPMNLAFRDRLEEAAAQRRDLVEVQTQNSDEGLEMVEAVRAGIRGGYWYLRNQSSLGEPFPAGRDRFTSLAAALEFAIIWWQAVPWCRGVMVSVADFERAKMPQRTIPMPAPDDVQHA